MRNIIEINKDAIDSIFVELQDDDFVVLPEIGTDIVSIEIIYKEVKKKKDGFFKRAFKRLKKFNEYEN